MTTTQPKASEQTPASLATHHAQRVLLSVEQAAEAIGIGRTTTFAMVKSGDLKSIKVGRLRRVPLDEVHAYTARLMAQQNPADTTEGN